MLLYVAVDVAQRGDQPVDRALRPYPPQGPGRLLPYVVGGRAQRGDEAVDRRGVADVPQGPGRLLLHVRVLVVQRIHQGVDRFRFADRSEGPGCLLTRPVARVPERIAETVDRGGIPDIAERPGGLLLDVRIGVAQRADQRLDRFAAPEVAEGPGRLLPHPGVGVVERAREAARERRRGFGPAGPAERPGRGRSNVRVVVRVEGVRQRVERPLVTYPSERPGGLPSDGGCGIVQRRDECLSDPLARLPVLRALAVGNRVLSGHRRAGHLPGGVIRAVRLWCAARRLDRGQGESQDHDRRHREHAHRARDRTACLRIQNGHESSLQFRAPRHGHRGRRGPFQRL